MEGPLLWVTHIVFFERKSDRKKSFLPCLLVLIVAWKVQILKRGHFGKSNRIGSRTRITTKPEFIAGNVIQA